MDASLTAIRTAAAESRPAAAAWLLAAALAGYVLYATAGWNVPEPGAVPFGPLWAGGTLAALALWLASGRRLRPASTIAIGAIVAMVLTDVSYLATQGLRDLHLYLRAGERFVAGDSVYLDGLFVLRPADLSHYPFLYPPLTLPLFAALSGLPRVAVEAGWLGVSLVAAVAVLRWFGVRGRYVALLLLWPPFFQGLQVGNVAVPLAVLFAVAPWVATGLVVAAVFKVYSGIAALWLLRERRIRPLVVGAGLVVAAGVATLPLVGPERWAEWWQGLEYYRASQPLLADYLYGFGLPRYLPTAAFLAVAGLVVVVALRAPGREGLARLGLATAVASPSLFSHGLIVGLPSFLALRPLAFWTAIAITSVAPGVGWWAAVGVAVAGWLVPALRRSDRPHEAEGPHPLGPGQVPWPSWPSPRPSGSTGSR